MLHTERLPINRRTKIDWKGRSGKGARDQNRMSVSPSTPGRQSTRCMSALAPPPSSYLQGLHTLTRLQGTKAILNRTTEAPCTASAGKQSHCTATRFLFLRSNGRMAKYEMLLQSALASGDQGRDETRIPERKSQPHLGWLFLPTRTGSRGPAARLITFVPRTCLPWERGKKRQSSPE